MRGSALALALVLAASGSAAAAPVKLSLAELIKIARERSRAVAVSRAERGVREAQKREALWSWAPSLDLTFGLSVLPDIACQSPLADDLATVQQQWKSMNPSLSTGDLGRALRQRDCVATNVPQVNGAGMPISQLTLGALGSISGAVVQGDLRLTQPLFSFGKIEAATQAAGHGIAAAAAQADGAGDEVALQAARAYWGLKAARAAIATIEDVRDRLKPWVAKIEKDLEATAPKYSFGDLRRMQLGLVQVDLLLADQERNAAIALHGLRLLAGDDAELDDAELELTEPADQPLGYFEGAALAHRPELHALDEGIAAYRWLARYSLAQMLPDLAFALSYGFRSSSSSAEESQSAYQNHINYQGVGAALVLRGHLDLAQAARLRHARADVAVVTAQRDLARSGVSLEIAQAYADLRESRRRYDLTDQGQRLARGWLTSIENDLDGKPYELIESARAYFDQRVRFYQAIYETNVNVARLRRASGVEAAR